MFKLGKFEFNEPIILAPMAGITDTVYREICKEMGADIVYTEFVSANGIIRENQKTLDMMKFSDKERPIGIQIFGDSAEVLGDSASLISERFAPDIIDINFGCPVPKVTRHGAGSGAMKDLNLMIKMTEAVVKNSNNIPVTIKMRAGWNADMLISTEAGLELEKAGIKMITLHPRTSKQRFTGKADWSLIKELKNTVSIPIIGNGDVETPEDYVKMKKETACDGVMLGRSTLGNPWIFSQVKDFIKNGTYKDVTISDKVFLCNKHHSMLRKEKTEHTCLNLTKKHYSWYLKGFSNAAYWRTEFMKCVNLDDFDRVLELMNKEISR